MMTEIIIDQRDSQHDYYPEIYILCFIVFLKLVLCMTMPGEREYLPEQQQRIQKIAVNVLRLSQSVSGYFSCEPNYEVPWSIRVHWLSANITISSRDEIRHVVLMQK